MPTRVTQLGPGGQAANVAAWVSELGGAARGSWASARRRSRPHRVSRPGSSATASRCAGPSSRAGPARSSRSSRSTASGRWPPTAASRPTPRRRARPRRGSTDATWLHLPGYSLLRSPIDEAAFQAAGLATRVSASISPPGARSATSGRAFPGAARAARARDRLRERSRGGDPRRADRARRGSSSRAREARASATTSCRRATPTSWTRRAQETLSPRATSSAGRSSRSRQRHAASRN